MVHKTVLRMTDAFEKDRHFNTGIALVHELVGLMRSDRKFSPPVLVEAAEMLVRILSPIIPHIAEEMWTLLGHPPSVFHVSWPQGDADAAADEVLEVQDLLGRERVELETENIRLVLRDRVVLVTGAGGSIGSELCRQIATYQPKRLLLVDRSEPQVFEIEQELIRLGHGRRIVPLVGDIVDRDRMKEILSSFRPQVIFHAAAHKHVPMMEHQPGPWSLRRPATKPKCWASTARRNSPIWPWSSAWTGSS